MCLAVLPFENLSVDQGRDHFARGFVEDLITELSRFPTLEVMSSRSAVALARNGAPEKTAADFDIDYLLSGNFRHSGDRLRINTRLIEPDRDTVVWAERYDAAVESLFDIQDDITSQVVASLSTRIDISRLAHARRKPPTELAAYDCWLRGMELLRRGTLADDEAARELFRQALELEPQSARAYAGLSLSYFNEWSCQLWDRWEENERLAFEYASQAIGLDETDHVIQLILGRIYLFRRDFERAERHLNRAYELNPNDADNLIQLSTCKALLGSPEEGVELMHKALRLNPYCDSWYYAYGALCYFLLQDYARALEVARRAPPDLMVDLPAFKGAACAYLGQPDEAARYVQNFRETFFEKITGGQPVEDREMLEWILLVNPIRDSAAVDRLAEGLRKAGLSGDTAPEARSPASPPDADDGLFHAELRVRHIRYKGKEAQLPDIKGFSDIETLLRRPGEQVHCTELFGVQPDARSDDVLDTRARAEYRARIEALREQLEEARERHDTERVTVLQEELDLIVDELGKATGLGGRSRKLSATAERARSAVTQRIRAAIARIAETLPELGQHLADSIRTGTFCAYEPEKPVQWQL